MQKYNKKQHLKMQKTIKDIHYLNELLQHLKLNANQFADSIGLDRTTRIYNVLNRRNKLSEDLAKLITNKYNNVNYAWLLTGKGDMLKAIQNQVAISSEEITMPREVFDQISRLTETILSQQKTIETLAETNKKIIVQPGDSAICADAVG